MPEMEIGFNVAEFADKLWSTLTEPTRDGVRIEETRAWLLKTGDQVRRHQMFAAKGEHAVTFDEVTKVEIDPDWSRHPWDPPYLVHLGQDDKVHWWAKTLVDIVVPEPSSQIGPMALMDLQMGSAHRAVKRLERRRAAGELKAIAEAL